MSAEEFWDGDPRLAVAYRKAERVRQENRYVAEWRAGVYVARAVASVLSEDDRYPPEPLFSVTQDELAASQEREKRRMEAQMERFGAIASAVNRRMDASGGTA